MIKRIGFIGVGHLSEFLITGFVNSGQKFEFVFSDPFPERSRKLAAAHGGEVFTDNQKTVDNADLVVLATRPPDVESALSGLNFRKDQVLVSVAVGVPLRFLRQWAGPARVLRVLPISCVAVNQSPVLIYPHDKVVHDLFSLVGTVHALEDETLFEPATSLVGAFYAWLFALMEEVSNWTAGQGIKTEFARQLVLETMNGACAMARSQNDLTLKQIWESLATPGGISEHGIKVINQKEALSAWSEALESVTRILRG